MMIQVQNLSKQFGRIKAVDGLNFEVRQGEILGLLGPNGAGKTTTMRILTGFLTPSEGTVRIDGMDILKHSRKIRARLGYLPEDVPLYRDATVSGFLKFVASVKGLWGGKKRRAIDEVLDLCRIGEVRKRQIGKLSKGFRQRVGLAQALLGAPPLLILDEPTASLDPKQINEIRELIRGFRGRHTVLLSTHILPEVSAVCDRVLIINEGKLVAQGTPEELGNRLRSTQEVTVTARGDQQIVPSILLGIEGVFNVESVSRLNEETAAYKISFDKSRDVRGRIAESLVGAGFELLELRSDAMTLEDIFLKLTREDAVTAEAGPFGEGRS